MTFSAIQNRLPIIFSHQLMLSIVLSFLLMSPLMAQAIDFDREMDAKEQAFIQDIRRQLTLSLEERDWIAEHPVVRVGFDTDYAPYSFIDQRGELVGVAPDLLNILSKSIGIKIEAVADLSWSEIMDEAKSKNLDAVATVIITPERLDFLEFSEKYIPTPLVIMTRQENTVIKSAADLNGKRVALVKGYSSSIELSQQNPGIIGKNVDTVLEALQALAAGEVDVFVGVLGVASLILMGSV